MENRYDRTVVLNGEKVACFSRRKFKEIKKEHSVTLTGIVGKGLRNTPKKMIVKDKELQVYDLDFNHLKYGIAGFLAVDEEHYIAIVKNRLPLRIMAAAAVLGAVCGLAFCLSQYVNGNGPVIDNGAAKYKVDKKMLEGIEKDKIAIPGYDDIKIKADTDVAYVALWNPETNPCYFKFRLRLKEGGTILYESNLVPPGTAITRVPLQQTFSKGYYPIIIEISSYSLEDYLVELNGGEVETRIVAVETAIKD